MKSFKVLSFGMMLTSANHRNMTALSEPPPFTKNEPATDSFSIIMLSETVDNSCANNGLAEGTECLQRPR